MCMLSCKRVRKKGCDVIVEEYTAKILDECYEPYGILSFDPPLNEQQSLNTLVIKTFKHFHS